MVIVQAAAGQAPPGGGFSAPLTCEIDRDCWIVNLPDTTPPKQALDHKCLFRTYDGHMGTDFAVRDYRAVDEGVPVVAAADGLVTAARDGEPDRFAAPKRGAPTSRRRDCGNGVILDHADGWESQYCHLKRGSVEVALGQRVVRGQRLGAIGLSGRTAFPHVHVAIRRNGTAIDPFTGAALADGCGRPEASLWHPRSNVRYPGFALYAAGFRDYSPTGEHIWSDARSPVRLRRHAPLLVLWGATFGVQPGDVLKLAIRDPAGDTVAAREVTITRNRARQMEFVGRRMPPTGWATGAWQGEVVLERMSNGRRISRRVVVPLTIR